MSQPTAQPSPADHLFDDAYAAPIDPLAIFAEWLAEARTSEINDANAMAVASVDEAGLPDVRMVLLNGFDQRGFVFFTNFESAKGTQLLASRKAALLFHWKSLRRQVRVRGPVEIVAEAEADAYFSGRPHGSQIASSASAQSRPLANKAELTARVADLEARYGDGPVPRPAHWSGFRIIPEVVELWQDGAFRLHDRMQFSRVDGIWARRRLNP